MTEELLPCPFCGGRDLWKHLTDDGYSAVVECNGKGCYAAGPNQYMHNLSDAEMLAKAVELWNQRKQAIDTAPFSW